MIATVTLNPSLDEWMELSTLRVGVLNRASGFARYPGGKGINVSRVIHALGGHTIAFALAGGEDGLILRELMNRLSIRHEFVTVEGPTRNNYKIRTTTPRALTEINTAGPRVSRSSLHALARRFFTHRPRPQAIAFSGSLPPGVPGSIYGRWIRTLRRLRIPTVLDTSGPAFRHGLAARPWLIKPNRDEAEEFLQRPLRRLDEIVRAARQLLRYGPEIVIVSLGRDGAVMAAASSNEVWLAPTIPVKAGTAVGAGDSLIGGFLVGWSRQLSAVSAFRLGVACGTATAMSTGTELCRRSDVQRVLRRVKLKRIG